ncbi:hypothetical protein ALC60_09331 [Trachymyrmex zeteki]|uniref:Uncharacterized protein n=1 Tax=Mycetomoellerius zeteki TaxID=64791 RepID=A0A151WV84_9HYME|nr:hypothetical protein ALC60_09331 [Trachymyrmex zeteki]
MVLAPQKREITCVLLWQKHRDERRTQDLSPFTVASLSANGQTATRKREMERKSPFPFGSSCCRHKSSTRGVYYNYEYYKRQILSEQGKRLHVKDCIVTDEICARQSCNRNAVQEFMACLVAGSLGVVERISVVFLAKLRGFNPLIMLLKARALPAHFSTCGNDEQLALRENHRKPMNAKVYSVPSSMLPYTCLVALAEGIYAEQTVRRMLSEGSDGDGGERTEVYDSVYGTSAQTTQANFGLSKVWHTWTAAERRDNQTGSNAINICVERGVGHFDQIPPNQRSRCLQFNRLILLLWFGGRNHSPFATRRKA